jgi:ATP-binding cassette subfamily G (WHITE) protein 2 (SNQ2)
MVSTFWMIGDTVGDFQLSVFSILNFIFVAPGVTNRLRPMFTGRRNIYETREKKSEMCSWWAFVTGLIVSEIPYLCICAPSTSRVGITRPAFPTDSSKSSATFFIMLMYELVYTGTGQFVAAYAPNAIFASLANPLFIGILVSFCGVLASYAQIQPFWRYWIYYLNPFNCLMGNLLTFSVFDARSSAQSRSLQSSTQPAARRVPCTSQTISLE